MAPLDSLPADQRAVLQLVLQQGRRYDDIAALLAIDRAGVRQRALSALDALGPGTAVPAERRGLITDYLLGQLPEDDARQARRNLAESPTERAWARIVASELGRVASNPLPEIPVEAEADEEEPSAAPAAVAASPAPAAVEAPAPAATVTAAEEPKRAGREGGPPISRRGGALLLGLAGLAIVVLVIVLIASAGSSNKSKQAATTAPTTSAGTTTSKNGVQVVAQINLTSPTAPAKTVGIAQVLRQGATNGLVIGAQNVPPNTKHDAYAVWLYNAPSDAHFLGFVNPGVSSNGRLSTAGPLPTDAGHFKQLLVTRETQSKPRQPGRVVLQGQLTGVS